MKKITNTYRWAGCLACLAIAVAANAAVAQDSQNSSDDNQQTQQQQQDENKATSQTDQQSSSSSDKQNETASDQQHSTSAKDRQRDQQQRAKDQQQRARDQQQRQSGEQAREWDETTRSDRGQWNQRRTRDRDGRSYSRFPQPSREVYTQEQQFRRESGSKDAGLGVSVKSSDRDGVTVTRVHRDSPAEEMGIEQGDRITQVNGREVQSVNHFISQIRQMDPGEEVEIEIIRDQDEQTVSGELESREDALVLRNQRSGQYGNQRGNAWQTDYESESRIYSQNRSGQSGQVSSQISQIERQIDRLSRELDQLRNSLSQIRQQGGRETTARYDEYQSDSNRQDGSQRTGSRNRSNQWNGDQSSRQYDGQSRRSTSGARSGEQSRDSNSDDSDRYQSGDTSSRSSSDPSRGSSSTDQSGPGGEIGEARQHVGSDDLNE